MVIDDGCALQLMGHEKARLSDAQIGVAVVNAEEVCAALAVVLVAITELSAKRRDDQA